MNKRIILLNLNPKSYNSILILTIILIISMLLSYFYKIYDSYYLTGIISCQNECSIKVTIPYNKVDIFKYNPHIEYINKDYKIKEVIYEEPYLDNGVPYEDIVIKTNIKSEDKIINFKILYNKQRVLKKILNLMEGDEY